MQQAKGIPPADMYVKISMGAQEHQSKVVGKSLTPQVHAGAVVTVYADALKACSSMSALLAAYAKGEYWVVARRSESDAGEKRMVQPPCSTSETDWTSKTASYHRSGELSASPCAVAAGNHPMLARVHAPVEVADHVHLLLTLATKDAQGGGAH